MALVPGAQAPLPHLICQPSCGLSNVSCFGTARASQDPAPPNSICNAAARGAASKCKSDGMLSLLNPAMCIIKSKLLTQTAVPHVKLSVISSSSSSLPIFHCPATVASSSPGLNRCPLGSRLSSAHQSWVKGLCSEKAFSGHCLQRSPHPRPLPHFNPLWHVPYLIFLLSGHLFITCFPSKALGWEEVAEFVLWSMTPSASSPGSGTWPGVNGHFWNE